MHSREEKMQAFGRLLDIMDELRVKCPWDRKQTNESLRPQTIEETYELSDAILKNDHHEICKELGDLLLHVVFYSKIGEENGEFDVADMINHLCEKLIYRHPHVFSGDQLSSAEDVIKNWEKLKITEKDGNKRVLSGVPESLPSVIKAFRIQDKARAVGFDWEKKEDVWEKVKEELGEYEEELRAMADAKSAVEALSEVNNENSLQNGSAQHDKFTTDSEVSANREEQLAAKTSELKEAEERAEEELGDFLFAVINAARLYKLNPDTALEKTCAKFRRRFTYLEEHTIRQGRNLSDMTLQQMDEIWDEAKAKGL